MKPLGYKPMVAFFQATAFTIMAFAFAGCGGSSTSATVGSPNLSTSFMPPVAANQAMFQISTAQSVSRYSSTILGDNPYQFFELADRSGTVATNRASGGSGTYFGTYTLNVTPGPIAGVSQGTLRCNIGTIRCVSMPNADWPAGSSYTLETWVKPNLTTRDITIWGSGYTHRLLIEPDGRLLSQFYGNYFSRGVLTNDVWSQVDFVYNASTRTASYYINGRLDSTSGTIPTSYASMSTYYLGQYDNSTNYKYIGELAEHSTYRIALTASQILTHYNTAVSIGSISMQHVLTYAYLGIGGAPLAPYGPYAPHVNWVMGKASDGNAISAVGIKVMVYTNPNREYKTDPLYTSDESTFAHTCAGARITTSDGAYLMNPASTSLWSLWENLIDTYQSQGHVDAFEADDAADLYGVSAIPCGYTAANWLSSTISEDASVSAPIVYNNLGLFSWDKVSPGIGLNASATGGLMENCYAEWWNPALLHDGDWRAIEDTEIQMAAQHKDLFCFAMSRTAGASAIGSRQYVYASFLLTYDPNTSILFEDYQTTPSHFWVFPESELVALNPVLPAPATITGLQVSTNVYAREYNTCYIRGSYVGPCAAVVNSDGSSSHPFPFPTKYHHAMTLSGGGVLDGGTVTTTGAPPSTMPALSGVVAFP